LLKLNLNITFIKISISISNNTKITPKLSLSFFTLLKPEPLLYAENKIIENNT